MSVPSPAFDIVRALLADDARALDLKALAGLAPSDVHAVARLGAAALAGQRARDACVIFAALEALEPSEAQHSLHRAWAEAAAGRRDEAVRACDRFLERGEESASVADTVRALLLRAGQRDAAEGRLVASDLAAARFLATRDAEARAVLEGQTR